MNNLWWPCSEVLSHLQSGVKNSVSPGTSRWLGGVVAQRRGTGDSDNRWSKLYTSKVDPWSYQNTCAYNHCQLCRYLMYSMDIRLICVDPKCSNLFWTFSCFSCCLCSWIHAKFSFITWYRICQEAVDRFFQAEEVRTKHPDSLICFHRFPDGNSYIKKTTIFGWDSFVIHGSWR